MHLYIVRNVERKYWNILLYKFLEIDSDHLIYIFFLDNSSCSEPNGYKWKVNNLYIRRITVCFHVE